MMGEHLGSWSVRNIAEYAYCPRLFYLMEVEGIFRPSEDTEEGKGVHVVADRPNRWDEEAFPAGDYKRVRRMTLADEELGLVGVLDVVELEGGRAIPVEYRRGRSCRRHQSEGKGDEEDKGTEEGAIGPEAGEDEVDRLWPVDRVQIGLQALLLRKAGWTVEEAAIYYAAEKRRVPFPVDDRLIGEALDVLKAARACAAGERPPPLFNDSRCPRCSLQPVCLPDEIAYERMEEKEREEWSPRRMWPVKEEGIQVVVQKQGCKIGVRGGEIVAFDAEGAKIKGYPLASLESLSLVGPVQISTQALQTLTERGVVVAFLSSAGRLWGIVDGDCASTAKVLRAQVRSLNDGGKRLELAKALIAAKIANQRTMVMRNGENLPVGTIERLEGLIGRVHEAMTVEEVMGYEGDAARIYFAVFGSLLKPPWGALFAEQGRKRRPPPDPVNAVLSMAYSMLLRECVAALRTVRMEPAIGALHVSKPGRPALALDLMEPFRPLVGDSIVLGCFNRQEFSEGHFLRTAAGCHLTDFGRKIVFGAWGRRMEMEVTHPFFGYRLSYRRMILLHARMLAAWFLEEIPSLEFLVTR